VGEVDWVNGCWEGLRDAFYNKSAYKGNGRTDPRAQHSGGSLRWHPVFVALLGLRRLHKWGAGLVSEWCGNMGGFEV